MHPRKSTLNIHWKDWYWSWSSNTLATWCEELTHWKRSWCWERLKAGEGDDRGWDGWMASQTLWAWVWASSGSWYWTEKPGMVQSMGSQRVGHNWATELNSFCLPPKAPFLKLKTSGRKAGAWRDPRLRIWLSCNPTSIWDSNGLIYPFRLEDAYREMRCLSA